VQQESKEENKEKEKKKKKPEQKNETAPTLRGTGVSRMKRRRGRAVEEDVTENEPEQTDARQEIESEPVKETKLQQPQNLSKAKMKKLQLKEEKAKAREAMLQAKKSREDQEDREIAERKRKRQKEEEQQRQEDEEFDKLRQENKKKEEEAYQLLKQTFEVEDAGSQADDQQAFEKALESFIEDIKNTKVVQIEDIAVKYSLQPKDVVAKIELLERQHKLSGIMDERGKYIYITEEEMNNVAAFINKRGRVNISDITRESNRLINLTPQVSEENLE